MFLYEISCVTQYSNRYVTSYSKALSSKVAGVDDYLFESHENIPVRRRISLKKSPIMLMKLVSEKMMMKHGQLK
jgi:hypothetical protein